MLFPLTIGLGMNTGCSKRSEPEKHNQNVEPNSALSVSTIQPVSQAIPITLSANGSIFAWQEAIMSAEISELRLTKINVQVGDTVKKGQILALFSDESILTDIAQSRAALAEMEAMLDDAQRNAERANHISTSGALSSQQINQYATTAKTAQAKVDAAKAKLDAQLLRLKYTKVLASDNGVISSQNATLGMVPTKGQELFRLIRENRLEWRGEVIASEMIILKPHMTVTLELPNAPDRITGEIRTIAPTLDEKSRYGLIYVDLPDTAKYGLRAGMFARGEFHFGDTTALTVPQTALLMREGFSYVFKLDQFKKDNVFHIAQVKVQIGRNVGDNIEIISGVSADDVLVASGVSFLADGDTVRVVKP